MKREKWNCSGVYEWGWRATTKGYGRFWLIICNRNLLDGKVCSNYSYILTIRCQERSIHQRSSSLPSLHGDVP